MTAKYVLGIDLGTTNSAFAYAPLDAEKPRVELLPIPQLVSANTVESRSTLPSFAYLAQPHEAGAGSFDLPWAGHRDFAVGEIARRQAAEAPDRTVSTAKSWLCHSLVDRHQPILPWDAPDDVPQISPITATQRYLEHLIAAWEQAFPDAPVAEQEVILTVPASFDVAARELTHQAALAAGMPEDIVLLEEPSAAVYAWLVKTGDRWRRMLNVGDTLVVCDVGGGTSDLTLVSVAEENGELQLQRLAVGNHLLIGGDNMDLALAHHVAGLFREQGVDLDPWQSVSLWHSCRNAKEALFSPEEPDSHPISILGRGSRLIGGTKSVNVERLHAVNLLLDGFFPHCEISARPARRRASGFQELGLPFESDTAITRHLAAFLTAHGGNDSIKPSFVLFNGGVFKAEPLRERLLDAFGQWFPEAPTQELEGTHDLDHAVAHGAAYYGWAKRRGGVRIRGGTSRSYYVGIETSGPAIPGAPRPLRALCVVPIGMEEGSEVDVPSSEIGLVLGEPVHFRFFSSPVRKQDTPGDVINSWSEQEIGETDSLEATLPAAEGLEDNYVPVRFQSRITELGNFELWCVSTRSDHRWKLEFSVREDAEQ